MTKTTTRTRITEYCGNSVMLSIVVEANDFNDLIAEQAINLNREQMRQLAAELLAAANA